ncbi:DnaJ-like protein subfamily A member 5 [Nematocida sp. AWRm80]|nr:DnaJ-like protein subfamily A member 5 [Nematocida sp. AWRm80]
MGQTASSPFANRRRTPHEILGVSVNATMDEIKKAYRAKAIEYHPDSPRARERGVPENAFIELNAAYETICSMHSQKSKAQPVVQIRKPEPDIDIQACIDRARRSNKLEEGDYAQINNLFLEITRIEKITRGVTYNPPTFGYAKGNPKGFYRFYSEFNTLRHFNVTPYDVTPHYDRLPRDAKREVDATLKKIIGRKRLDYAERVKELVRIISKKDPRLMPPPKKIIDLQISKPKIVKNGVELSDKHQMTKEELEELAAQCQKPLEPKKKPKADPYTEAKNSTQTSKDVFICEPCKKVFKSINQLTNHVNSKKHKQILDSLSVLELEELINALEECKIEDTANPTTETETTNTNDHKSTTSKKTQKKQENTKGTKTKSKKNNTLPDDITTNTGQPQPKKLSGTTANTSESIDDTNTNQSAINSINKTNSALETEEIAEIVEENKEESTKKVSKPEKTLKKQSAASGKKGKKGKPTVAPAKPKNTAVEQYDIRAGQSFTLSCAKCKEVFPTRNLLFAHLKESGHSAVL